MGSAAAVIDCEAGSESRQYRSGHYEFKDWVYSADGARTAVARSRGRGYARCADLVSTAYRNSDGSRTVYGIVLDLDAHRADPRWFDAEHRLDWGRMREHLATEHGAILGRISHVVRSTGMRGLAVVIAINPLPMMPSTARNQLSAHNLQSRLINLFGELGFGADPGARGLIRDYPNFEDSTRCVVHDRPLLRRIEARREAVVSELHRHLNEFDARHRSERRLYPDARVERGLAFLFEHLLGIDDHGFPRGWIYIGSGEEREFSVRDLMKLTGLSERFLRGFLKAPPAWLRAEYDSREVGWRLSVPLTRASERLVDRAEQLTAGKAQREPTRRLSVSLAQLCRPESVEDGERNEWLTSVALIYKWCGFSRDEAQRKLALRAAHIPKAGSSRNCKELRNIVRSLYRNVPETEGRYAGRELPVWLVDDVPFLTRTVSGTRPRRGVAPGLSCVVSVLLERTATPQTLGFEIAGDLAPSAGGAAQLVGLTAPPLSEEGDERSVARMPRVVSLAAIRHRQRVGIFDGLRMVACFTRRHYRAKPMLAHLARRREYEGVVLRVHTPHRRFHEAYFAAIDAYDAPANSGNVLGRRPTWAMSLRSGSVGGSGDNNAPVMDVAPSDVPIDISFASVSSALEQGRVNAARSATDPRVDDGVIDGAGLAFVEELVASMVEHHPPRLDRS